MKDGPRVGFLYVVPEDISLLVADVGDLPLAYTLEKKSVRLIVHDSEPIHTPALLVIEILKKFKKGMGIAVIMVTGYGLCLIGESDMKRLRRVCD